jgi:titin
VQLPVAITTTALPAGAVNVAYTATASAVNGVAPYTFTAAGLPAGLTMAANGAISGTPLPVVAPPVTFPVVVTVTDGAAGTASVTLNLVINYTIPAAPSLLTAKPASMTQINLTWVDNANNETGFTLLRATDALFTKGLITVPLLANATTYADLTVVANSTYYYRIASSNGLGTSVFVVAAPVTTPKSALLIATTTLLPATQGITYTDTLKATGGVVAAYVWSATGLPAGLTVAPATGIISGVTLAPAAIYPATVTVNDGTTAAGVSMLLNLTVKAAKAAVPAQPTGLTAVAVAVPKQVNLTWVDNAATETGFSVQRATDKSFKKGLISTVINVPNTVSYSDLTTVTGTIYYYRVNAINAVGVSAYSNVVQVTAP